MNLRYYNIMKTYFLVLLFSTALSLSASAQRLMIGEKAPELKISEWLNGKPELGKKVYIIEFAHTTSPPSMSRLDELNNLAKSKPNINVILLFKESKDIVQKHTKQINHKFFVALDNEGKTFSTYGVNFVPFSIVLDKKGHAIWFGNSDQLNDKIINDALK